MKRVIALSVATVVLGVAVTGFVAFRRPAPGDAVVVEIPSGATTTAIGELLAEQEVIGSLLGFRLMARVRGLDGGIQAGRYELARGMGVHAALDELSGAPDEKGVSVAVPEGFSLRQIAERLGANTQLSTEEFTQVTISGEVRASIQPEGVDTLEGFLFPETYLVGERETAVDVARRMVSTFESRTASLDWSRAEALGVSAYEALIIASMVEREARVDEDRAKIAAVIHNRLAIGMRLQIDITALYGLDEHKVPSRADLRRESPYNTYLIDGLPPTPIANPGRAAIEAALHPADIDAIFYVVIDPSGRHGFTDDPAEFERLKEMRPPEVRGG